MSDSDIRHLWQWMILLVGLVFCYRGNVVHPFCVKHYKKMSDRDIRHLWQRMILLVGLVYCYRGNVVSAEYAILSIPTMSNITKNV